MKRWLVRFAWLLFAGVAARAADDNALKASKPEVKKEIVAAIEAQLAAFRAGDTRKAYGYAAAALQAQKPFRVFVGIVQTSYPEIWASTRAEYGIVRDNGTTAQLAVHVFGKDSDATYDYTLVKEKAGWRIHDVLRHEPDKREKV
jgi:hypothetical protein